MSPSRGTKLRNVRISDDLWEALQAAAEEEGTNASELIRGMIEVYLEGLET